MKILEKFKSEITKYLSKYSFRYILIFIFFSYVLFGLFLGDGKQTAIEIYTSIIAVILIIPMLREAHTKQLPSPIHYAWIVLILYHVLATIFSISPGASSSALLRLILAYIFFSLFAKTSTGRTKELFAYSLIGITCIAIGISTALLIFPAAADFIPLMNLIYPTYGHNHLADLLLLTFPVVHFLYLEHKIKIYLYIYFLYGFIITFSRGILWLIVIIIVGSIITAPGAVKKTRFRILVSALVIACFICAVSLLSANQRRIPRYIPASIERLIIKPTLIADDRLRYWTQALRAIQDKPLFGHGPGTFYLLSKQYESIPGSHSWFAHNFVLEQLSEIGLIGFFLFIYLMFTIRKNISDSISIQAHTAGRPITSGLIIGVLLTLIYSLFEFNLEYLIIWSITWAILGALIHTDTEALVLRTKSNAGLRIACAYLILFTLVSIVSTTGTMSKYLSSKNIFILNPFYETNALRVIRETTALTDTEIMLLAYLHPKNPEIYFELAKKYENTNKELATRNFKTALKYNPVNINYREYYIQFLFQQNDIINLREELQRKSGLGLNESWTKKLYTVGYYLLSEHDSNLVSDFWRVAAKTSPSWSHVQIEYASLLLTLNKKEEAKSIINTCINDIHAREHCRIALTWLTSNQFPQPGYLADEIIH